MNTKKILQSFILLTLLLALFASTSPALAASCGTGVTVVSGDTLRKIADRCGTTVSALRLANPEIGSGNLIYPGQALILPGAILGTDGGFFIVSHETAVTRHVGAEDRRQLAFHADCRRLVRQRCSS